MAWTQTDLDALKAAAAKGERIVSFADRSVTYRSGEEILQLIKQIESELAAAAGRPKLWPGYSSKGF